MDLQPPTDEYKPVACTNAAGGVKGSDHRQRTGRTGEEEAAELFRLLGYRLLERNFRCRAGELDLVVLSPDRTLVFAEVKTSRSAVAGAPEGWITPRKQRQVARIANYWLALHPPWTGAIRFDAVCVRLRRKPDRTLVLHWPAAFTAF